MASSETGSTRIKQLHQVRHKYFLQEEGKFEVWAYTCSSCYMYDVYTSAKRSLYLVRSSHTLTDPQKKRKCFSSWTSLHPHIEAIKPFARFYWKIICDS